MSVNKIHTNNCICTQCNQNKHTRSTYPINVKQTANAVCL